MTERETVAPDPRMVKLVYALFLLSLFFGPIVLAGLAIAYDQRRGASPWVASHYRFQIRSVWISLLLVVCVAFPAFFVLATAIMGTASPSGVVLFASGAAIIAVLVWWIIRCVRGLSLASKQQAIPSPVSWLFGG